MATPDPALNDNLDAIIEQLDEIGSTGIVIISDQDRQPLYLIASFTSDEDDHLSINLSGPGRGRRDLPAAPSAF